MQIVDWHAFEYLLIDKTTMEVIFKKKEQYDYGNT